MPHDDDASVGVIDVKQPCRPSDPLPRAREQPSHNQRKHSADLMSSMSALGLQTPVTIRKAEDGTFTLLVGHHRYEAARRMGWSELPVIIHDADEHNARLWQLAENLHRKELTVLERSEQIKQWIELAGIDGQVVSKSGPGRPEGLVARAARALPQGRSAAAREKNVRRALLIERIDAQAKEMLRKAGLDDNQQALLEVARQPTAESQAKKAIELSAGTGPATPETAPRKENVADDEEGRLTFAALIAKARKFHLVLLTPSSEHLKAAGKTYAESNALQSSLPLFKVMHENAALAIGANPSDASTVFSLISECCFGAAKRVRVLVLRRPNSPDITQEKALFVAEFGKPTFRPPRREDWLDPTIEVASFTKRLYPDSLNALHLFAAENRDGWVSVIGSDTWVEEPSVK